MGRSRHRSGGAKRRRPVVAFVPGDTWTTDDGTWSLVSIVRTPGLPSPADAVRFLCQTPLGDRCELTLAELQHVRARPHDMTALLQPVLATTLLEEDAGRLLRPDELETLRAQRKWLMIWVCGDEFGNLDREQPRDGVKPHPLKRPPKGQGRIPAENRLRHAMALEDGVDLKKSRFAELLTSFLDGRGSLLSLMNASLRARVLGPLAKFDVQMLTSVAKYVEGVPADDTLELQGHYELADRRLREDGLEPSDFSERSRQQSVRELLRGLRFTAPAASRASKNGRPEGAQGRFIAAAPYEQVQIDGWDCNLFAMDQYGNDINVALLVAIDVFTRVILALLLVPKAYTAEDVMLLIADSLKGGPVFPSGESTLPALPESVIVDQSVLERLQDSLSPAQRREVARQIAEVGVDNGSQMIALLVLRKLCAMGIDVAVAPPGTGVAKALIESFFRTLGSATQTFDGNKARSSEHRGRKSRAGAAVPRDLLEAAIRMFVDLVYHHSPHSALGTTPMNKLQMELTIAGTLPAPGEDERWIQLLPEAHGGRVVNDEGIRVDTFEYDCAEIKDLKRHTQGDAHFDSRPIPVRYHPYDRSYVIVRDLTGRLITVPERDLEAPVPMLQDVRTRLMLELQNGNSKRGDFRKQAVALLSEALRQAALPDGTKTSRQRSQAPDDDVFAALEPMPKRVAR